MVTMVTAPGLDEIPEVPDVPEGVREASLRGALIPFVGAGASQLAGCPGWSDFARGALIDLAQKGALSHAQIAQLDELNPRIKLSLALAVAEEAGVRIDFRRLLHPSGHADHPTGRSLFAALSKLGRTFVTTNYDLWLDTAIVVPELIAGAHPDSTLSETRARRPMVHRIADLQPAILSQPNVIHLHGSVEHPEGMIMTTQHYLRHYANDRGARDTAAENQVLTFLTHLFEQKIVLFVGYGLAELEILEYIVQKARPARGSGGDVRHYIIQGFFSHELELMRALRRYFLEFGIQLIPFCRDRNDWGQLVRVMTEFARIAPAADPLVLQKVMEMERLLDDA